MTESTSDRTLQPQDAQFSAITGTVVSVEGFNSARVSDVTSRVFLARSDRDAVTIRVVPKQSDYSSVRKSTD